MDSEQTLVTVDVPIAFYKWLAGIERDVLVHDLTPFETAGLVAALRDHMAPVPADQVGEVIDRLQWINSQAESAMAISAGAASTSGDPEGALQMLNSIASDIGINAMMEIDRLNGTTPTAKVLQDDGEVSCGR